MGNDHEVKFQEIKSHIFQVKRTIRRLKVSFFRRSKVKKCIKIHFQSPDRTCDEQIFQEIESLKRDQKFLSTGG